MLLKVRTRVWSVVLLFGWAGATAAWAQPVPKLNGIDRDWVARGETLEARLTGENLLGLERFTLSGGEGLALSAVPGDGPAMAISGADGGIQSREKQDGKSLAVRVTVSAAAKLGRRDIRVVTPSGVSNPVAITVSDLAEVRESGGNQSLARAQVLNLPAVLSGRIGAGAEVDYFQFEARRGQRIVLEVMANRMGSSLDSSLAILDVAGKELARNEDARGFDSVLVFETPADGKYAIELRDFRYRGGNEYGYRLRVGEVPWVTSVFPLGGRRGHPMEIQVEGENLGGMKQMILQVDAGAPVGTQELRAETRFGVSNPFLFSVSDGLEVLETEPNSAIDKANAVPVPANMNGRIDAKDAFDAFKFSVQKDQVLVFEVRANRLGSALDALLTLGDASGKVLQRNDDGAGAVARIQHRFTEAGEYVCWVSDLLGRGGREYGYRLSISAPEPSFEVRFQPDAARIHQGAYVPIRCELSRLNGFSEPVRVRLGHAIAGVFHEPLWLSAETGDSGWLFLAAAESAALGTHALEVIAEATAQGKRMQQRAVPLAGDRPMEDAYLTVLPKAPFALDLLTLSADFEQNQSGAIQLMVHREAGFEGEVKLSAEGYSAGRELITRSFDVPSAAVKGGELRGALNLKARLDSEVGRRPVIVRGEATVNGETVAVYSRPLAVGIAQAPFVLSTTLKRLSVTALPAGTQSAANEAVFSVKADRRAGFAGEIQLALEGVPEGIQMNVTKIAENSGEAVVRLIASEKAPVGKEFTVRIVGTGSFKDRMFRHEPEAVKLAVNAPEAGEAAQQTAAK